VATGSEDEENNPMKCRVCGGAQNPVRTDLPFKVADSTIVILKELPTYQCATCFEYSLDDQVMARVDEILAAVDLSAELEVIRFAA
jgi:YgiT-type zinc finger domain-containing protein